MARQLRWNIPRGISSALFILLLSVGGGVVADEPTAPAKETPKTAAGEIKDEPGKDLPGLTRLSPKHAVWIDLKRKLVVVDGEVCLQEGQLEMFACTKGTKEHESLIAVQSDGATIHAGLLAVGAKSGATVKFDPVYVPASGTKVDILLLWVDADGKRHKDRAQEWIRDVKTKKEMKHPWVFAGSGFWTDEQTGKKYYQADGGDLVCVSNFPSAMLDLPIESSQAAADLMFEGNKDRIPPKGTKVRMVFQPQLPEEKKPMDAKQSK